MAVILVAAAGAIFLSMYPGFNERAENYNQDSRQSIQGEDFLLMLYKSNYVLYKEIADKTEETSYNYADLYLELEREMKTADEALMAGSSVYENLDSYVHMLKEDINALMESWRFEVMDRITEEMDYCVIDDTTGQYIKNTGRNIEALSKNRDSEDTEKPPYVYYVKISYDGAGNIGNVAVKGEDAEELLKGVQRIMKSGRFESNLNYVDANSVEQTVYGHAGSVDAVNIMEKMVYRTKAPVNTTFIYAMTKEQKEAMTMGPDEWSLYSSYYYSGVPEVYAVFLITLAAAGLLLTRLKKYCLHRLKAVRIPLELAITAGLLIYITGGEAVVSLVCYTGRGNFQQLFSRYLPFLAGRMQQIAVMGINFLLLILVFGLWFYFVNSLGEVTVLGIVGYLKERSLLTRIGTSFWHFVKRQYAIFKKELLHVDLGEETGKAVRKVVIVNFLILAIMCSMWFFGWAALLVYSFILYFAIKKYVYRIQEQYRMLLKATGSIAEGNLHTDFEEDLGVFESYKEELYKIQEGFRKAVDEEVKSQRMKAELITNVSHDLKTPLTAITTYIDLLKEENITEEQRKEYIGVLERKSLRLKSLIEDLFEVSKANSKSVTINPVDVDICNLIRQVYLEYTDRIEETGLNFRFRLPEEKMILRLDSQKTYRIFENLYTNIIKYAMPDTRVYISVEKAEEKTEEKIRIEMKNMSAVELDVEPEELTERFVRGDSSRNTEGNGLGLAIARSFTELQGGSMEVGIDGDLFKVTLEWKL